MAVRDCSFSSAVMERGRHNAIFISFVYNIGMSVCLSAGCAPPLVPPTGSLLGIYRDAVCLCVCLQGVCLQDAVPRLWYHPLALCSVSTVTLCVCMSVCRMCAPPLVGIHPLALCSLSTVTLCVCVSVCRMCPASGTTHWLSARYLL